jgi:hypothetical protein
MFNFEDIQHMFHLQQLGIEMVRLWCRGGSGGHPLLQMHFKGLIPSPALGNGFAGARNTPAPANSYFYLRKLATGALPAPKNAFSPAPKNAFCSSARY